MAKRITKPTIPVAGKIMYGSGCLGYSAVQQTCNGIIFYFGTVAHNVWPVLMGLATSLGMMWDAVTDPVVGYMSDKTKSVKFGKRHGYMLVSMFYIAIFNILLWSLPSEFPMAAKFFWFLLGIMVLELGNTFFQTPYHALGVELSGDYNERTSIQAFKTVFVLLGMVVPTVLMGIMLTDHKDINQYVNISYITSTCMLIFGALAIFGSYNFLPRLHAKSRNADSAKIAAETPAPPPETAEEPEKQTRGKPVSDMKVHLKQAFGDFFSALKKKDFRALMLGYAISLMASSFITTVGLHFFKYTFGFEFSSVAILMGTLFLFTIASQPFWIYISKKIDKKATLIIGEFVEIGGVLLTGMVFILYQYFNLLQDNPIFFLLPCMAIIGMGVGVMFSMPSSMLGDLLSVERAKTGQSNTGTYNAFMTFAYKMSQSLTLLTVGSLLQIVGFDSNLEAQSSFVRGSLGWIVIIGVTTVLAIGIFMYSKYSIKKKDVPIETDISLLND